MITERARAKVNLTLEILGRRGDGYHQVRTLIAFARDVYDIVALDPSRPAGLEMAGPFASAVAGPNIAEAALQAARDARSDLRAGHITIEKNLPVAAGVGGGSANAGAVLRALARANPEVAERGFDWHRIALRLGADVPVCFDNRGSLRGGIGERLDGAGLAFPLSAILVNPMQPVPTDKTAQVFKLLAAKPFDPDSDTGGTLSFASADEQLDYIAARGNDLEAAAKVVAPQIDDVLQALRGLGSVKYAALSGAGPTCFAITEDAEAAAVALTAAYPEWWVAATVLE